MTQSDLLDVLIGAIILLVALIGLWQGIVRTLLYLGGAFLGSELALWWADDLGDRLADWLPMATGTGRFVASTTLIVTSMVIVGACFGTLLWRYPADWRSRVGGLIAGIVLGAVTIGLVLRYNMLFMQARADAALGETRLAWRLWEDFDLVIGASAIAMLAMVIAGWVLGPADQELIAASTLTGRPTDRTSQPLREAVDRAAPGSGIYEGSNLGVGQRYSSSSAESTFATDDVDEALFAAPSTNGPPKPDVVPPPAADRAELRVEHEASDIIRDDPDFGSHRTSMTETVTFATEANEDRRVSAGICPNCGMLLKSGDAFCSDCGFPVES